MVNITYDADLKTMRSTIEKHEGHQSLIYHHMLNFITLVFLDEKIKAITAIVKPARLI
ncbi:hypothetical protein WN48_07799 [Eufriesea mexicana]|uniref:Uncharacterized protein n=1 Tax=Eufriesea mexicana TaxID=516756 RepID=A0A310S8G8_9HYME|nr:hypothetical protein WN48_07799 [Eufriesea mexicana]